MKKLLLLISLLIWACIMHSQQINTCSGSTQKNEFSAEWIIGGSLIDNSMFVVDVETTGIEIESPNDDVIAIHPTVTKDFLTIICKNELKPNINYRINNSMGITVMNGPLNNSTLLNLDVKKLAEGYYIIIFSSQEDKSFLLSKKFIKQ